MSTAELGGRPARLGVDVPAALNLVGSLVMYLGPVALLPAVFAVAHDEAWWPFLAAGAIVSGGGLALRRLTRGAEEVGVREGFLVICLAWLVAGAYGALPFVLAGDPQLGRPVDAFFEGMSGFTTTGVSLATDVEALPVSMVVWRHLMVWFGGVGVVALGIAVLPRLRVGGRQLLESELSSGPGVEALSSRIRDTVQRFGRLYVVLTVCAFLVFAVPGWLGGGGAMDTFQAFAHALTTIPTGGFSTETESIGAFDRLTQWSVIVFMVVGGVNFLVLYRGLFQRRVREAARDEEFRVYVGVLLVAGAVLAAALWIEGLEQGEGAVRAGVFEATAVITTTGYFTADYGQWPLFALLFLALLFFVGGCAGSTSGSIKIVRHVVLARLLGREVVRTIHPELVRPVRYNRAPIDQQALFAVISFVLIYIAAFVLATAILAVDAALEGRPHVEPLDLIFASASTLANSGVGLGAAGPSGSFESFGDPSTFALTLLMWAGRLEILPIIVLLRRTYWRV